MSHLNFMCCNFEPFPLNPREKSLALPSPHASLQEAEESHEVTLRFLFSTLDKLKVLSLSSEDTPSSPLPSLGFLSWRHSRTLTPFCSGGAQHCAQLRLHQC